MTTPEHTLDMEDSEGHSNNSQELEEQDSGTEDSDSDLDNPAEDDSSSSSAGDTKMSVKNSQCALRERELKEEREGREDLENGYICPLCTLEFSSPEQLIAHVYQHTTVIGGSKSYLCPVCGRALSSPGSLGRHLLIHSDDRLSNCAVCGARFTDTNNLNREKLQEFLSDETCSLSLSLSGGSIPDASPGPVLPCLSDSLTLPPPSLPPLSFPPEVLAPEPVHPAGVLLVCNACVAYQRLVESQLPSARRRNEPQEARRQRLERERQAKKSKRACESAEERELRRLRDRQAKRLQRLQETEEQRARRLRRDREAMRLKRANESPEKRQARLVREREAKRLKRRLEKIDPALRTQIGHEPAALTADMSLFQFPCPSLDNGLFTKLP